MDASSDPEGGIEAGALLPVLRRASHDDLLRIAASINKGLDVFITWDKRYDLNKNDLTKVPEVIGEYLLRAGGHSVMNRWRAAGPDYREVVRGVCSAFKVKLGKPEPSVMGMEIALLQVLFQKVHERLTEAERADLMRQMQEAAGRPVSFDDLLKGTTLLGLVMPLILTAIARQALKEGIAAGAQVLLGRLGTSIAGPIGFIAGTAWLASDFAGPSLRATVPAIVQVALLRQRMLYESLE